VRGSRKVREFLRGSGGGGKERTKKTTGGEGAVKQEKTQKVKIPIHSRD